MKILYQISIYDDAKIEYNISDLIDECMKGNVDLCFLILRSLADIDKLINYKKIEDEDDDDDATDYYTNPININPGEKDIINRKLEENNKIVKKFIVNIYKSIGNITGNEKYH